MKEDMFIQSNVAMLTCNLAKTKHFNWWNDVGNGHKVKTNLVSIMVTDLVRANF
jgi:hypothetical protein